MFAIIVLAVAALVALMVFGFAIHVLFSPWLLLAAVAIVAWIKFRPSRPVPGKPPGCDSAARGGQLHADIVRILERQARDPGVGQVPDGSGP